MNLGNAICLLIGLRISRNAPIEVILTLDLLAKYPALSDGAIATGQILSPHGGSATQSSFGRQYAHQHDPDLFTDYRRGYIVPGTGSNIHQGFQVW